MDGALSYLDALKYILPELALTLGLCAVLVWEMVTDGRRRGELAALSLGFLAITGWLLIQRLDWAPRTVFGMMRVDSFATIFKLFITSATAIVVVMDWRDQRPDQDGKGETWFLLMTAALGGFVLVSSWNILLLYLGLETLGLSSYALAGIHKRDVRGAEASIKYVVYGALASGFLIYGASLLYGLTGTLDMSQMIPAVVRAVDEGHAAQLAIPTVLVLVGFAYKLSLFPFQWWAPDVYEGVSTPVAGFLAVASKGVALAALLRFLATVYEGLMPHPAFEASRPPAFASSLVGLLALLSAMTMVFGNFAALRQNNLKRLFAYSSIGHAGYLLMGVALISEKGFEAAVLYVFLYYLMTLGAFLMILYFANESGREDVAGLRGMGYRHPLAGVASVVLLASLTGLPPTAGFVGKWYLMVVAWDGGLRWLALLTALMSLVSLYYYFRIAKALFLRPVEDAPAVRRNAHSSPMIGGLLVAMAVASLVFLDFQPLLDVARAGVTQLFYW